jgi:hypothetical protein
VKYAHWEVVRAEMAQYNGQVMVSELNDEAVAAFELLATQEDVTDALSEEMGDAEAVDEADNGAEVEEDAAEV